MASSSQALVRDNFDSISEGCFLVMPKKRRQRNADATDLSTKTKRTKGKAKNIKVTHRSEEDSQEILNDGFQQLFKGKESIESMLFRKQSFKKCWSKVNDTINTILLDMNREAIQQICDFVDKDHDVDESLIKLPYHEIPTGLVFAGINTPDHDSQFQHIADKLQEDGRNNYVALLQSKDCMNIKNMMKTMIANFMNNVPDQSTTNMDIDDEAEHDMEDDEDIIRVNEPKAPGYSLGNNIAAKPSKCLPYDMQLLEGWYKHNSNEQSKPNLVVILQDFESFEPAVFQDFFSICSEYRSRLPIICIVGIATSSEILHQSLNKSTIGLLRIEKFKLEQSEVWFNRVIESLFMGSTYNLKFGTRPYKFILDHFYLYDFSISKVTASLKYAFMDHFYGNPLSIFLPLLELEKSEAEAKLTEWLDEEMISEHHITYIRMLQSFKMYIESLVPDDPKKALRLLEDDDYLVTKMIPSLISDIKIYQQQFKMGINLIVLLQSQFPKLKSFKSLRKSKRMILLDALDSRQTFSEEGDLVKLLVILIRKIDEEHIGKLLTELRQFADQEEYEDVNKSVLKQLDQWDVRFEQLMAADDDYVAEMDRKAKRLEGMVLPDEDIGKGRHTETARKVQTQSIEHIKNKGTETSKIAMDIADWLDKTLTLFLRSYTQLPLYELFYYTNIKLHEKSFASQPRASIQTALTQPQHYINCPCCHIEKSDQILPSEHDTCILYKLYLECGKMINLYDWFVAFGCIIEREKRSPNKKLEENEVQARFIKSVAELQYLGFIKPTQRKTDHVIRLTWSNI